MNLALEGSRTPKYPRTICSCLTAQSAFALAGSYPPRGIGTTRYLRKLQHSPGIDSQNTKPSISIHASLSSQLFYRDVQEENDPIGSDMTGTENRTPFQLPTREITCARMHDLSGQDENIAGRNLVSILTEHFWGTVPIRLLH